jgi:hypothetical protein
MGVDGVLVRSDGFVVICDESSVRTSSRASFGGMEKFTGVWYTVLYMM